MMKPQVRRIHVGGNDWLIVSAEYASAFAARNVWDKLASRVKMQGGRGGVGMYRHGPPTRPGTYVTVVGLVDYADANVRKAAHILRGGNEADLTLDVATKLVIRRARVVVEHAGETGRLKTRRPDDRGAALTDSGESIDPDPPRG